jgi:hypothetical protein
MLPVTKSADKILQGKFMGLSKVWIKFFGSEEKISPILKVKWSVS